MSMATPSLNGIKYRKSRWIRQLGDRCNDGDMRRKGVGLYMFYNMDAKNKGGKERSGPNTLGDKGKKARVEAKLGKIMRNADQRREKKKFSNLRLCDGWCNEKQVLDSLEAYHQWNGRRVEHFWCVDGSSLITRDEKKFRRTEMKCKLKERTDEKKENTHYMEP